MKVIIFGASGATGQLLVQEALAQRHSVTAFARNPDSILAAPAPGLAVVKGDVYDGSAVSAAIAGHHAVLSALGARSLGHSDLLEKSMRNILAGMAVHAVSRIIVLGASGAGKSAAQHQGILARLFLKLVENTILREPFRSQQQQEQLLQSSNAQYTIVLPPRLLNRPATGHVRVQQDGLPPGGLTIPRADVAEFMVRQLTDTTWIRKSPYLAT
jgi:putative NADH-flavin reductase